MNEQLTKVMATGGRAIPGQSLTNDPENPAPFERPPKFTTVHEASEDIFDRLVSPERLPDVMEALDDGNPIMDITQAIVFQGFNQGKWNADLMMMLVEPVAYMLLALAERFEIEAKIYHGEEEDDEEVKALGVKMSEERIAKMKEFKNMGSVPSGILNKGMMQEIEALPEMESLLGGSAPEEQEEQVEEEEGAMPSLMAKPSAPAEEEEEMQ